MIATVDDVLAGFKALWYAAGVPALVTGGLYDARAIPATAAPPLAVMKATPAEKQTFSVPTVYLEKFMLSAWLHSVNATHDRTAMARLMDRINRSEANWPATRGRCLHVQPAEATKDASPFANQARDIAVTPMAWEILMQQG